MANTIQIISVERTGKEAALQTEYGNKSIKTIDGYHFNKNLNSSKFTIISKLLSNKVSQIILTKKNFTKKLANFSWVLEINYLPGVTDNIASTTKEIINDNLKNEIKDFRVGSSKFFLLRGQRKEIEKIAKKEANPLIQTIKIYSYSDYKKFFHNFMWS